MARKRREHCRCGTLLTPETAYLNTGRRSTCKKCCLEEDRRWREKNKERFEQVREEWRIKHEGYTYVDNASGYVIYVGFNHPVATPKGLTRHHRMILWDKLNGKDADCAYCGKHLYWSKRAPYDRDAMTVDHVNSVRHDNREENLVPCCASCNTRRAMNNRDKKPKEECTFEGCTKDRQGLGALCATHAMQKYLGKELTPIRRQLTEAEEQYIEEQVKAGAFITSLAKELQVDNGTVSRAFKRMTGKSVRQYRMEVINNG